MNQNPVNGTSNADLRKAYKRQSQGRDIWRRFCKNKMAVAALIILSIIAFWCIHYDDYFVFTAC